MLSATCPRSATGLDVQADRPLAGVSVEACIGVCCPRAFLFSGIGDGAAVRACDHLVPLARASRVAAAAPRGRQDGQGRRSRARRAPASRGARARGGRAELGKRVVSLTSHAGETLRQRVLRTA